MTIDRNTLTPRLMLEKYILPKIAPAPNSGCWFWLGHVGKHGRATVKLPTIHTGSFRTESVARFIYENLNKSIPQKLWLSNSCKTDGCVNPDHFEVKTAQKALRDAGVFERKAARRTECPRGHPYTPENTRVRRGGRECICCKRKADRERRRRKRIEFLKQGHQSEEFELSQKLSLSSKKYYVYHLINPATKEVFYVGKGSGKRAMQHVRDAMENARINPEKEARIRTILGEGLRVKIVIVQRNMTEERAFLLEKQEIERIGIERLTNRACGITPAITIMRHGYAVSA